MTKLLLKNIDAVPALPETVHAVEEVCQTSENIVADLSKVIGKDPLLTAEVLRMANSPIYGLSRKVADVAQAISLLGKETIRAFVLNNAVNSSFVIDLSPYEMTKEQFSNACEKQAALAINWLRKKQNYASVIVPAAFLVDLGRVIIAKTLIENNDNSIKEALSADKDISKAEKEACGAQATDVTATLFNNWQLNPDTIHIIRYSDDPDGTIEEEREMAAYLKAIRETVLPNGDITDASIEEAKETIEEFELDLEAYEKALEKIL